MGQIELLNPVGESADGDRQRRRALAQRLGTLEGATLGIFANGWQCMTYLADELRERLPREYGVKEVVLYESPTTAALQPQVLDQAAARCDGAIVGLGT